MQRDSIILGETNFYECPIYNPNKKRYDIGIVIQDTNTLYNLKERYLKIYINRNGHNYYCYDSKMCRLSINEPKYLGYEYEDLVFTKEELKYIVEFLSEDNYAMWKYALYSIRQESNDLDGIDFNTCPEYVLKNRMKDVLLPYDIENFPMPDYSKLTTLEELDSSEDDIAKRIYKYSKYKEQAFREFYEDLKYCKTNIVHSSKSYEYRLVDNEPIFRVYLIEHEGIESIKNSTPYCEYGLFDQKNIPNKFYPDPDTSDIHGALYAMKEISNIRFPHIIDLNFDIYEMMVLLYSVRNNIPFEELFVPYSK